MEALRGSARAAQMLGPHPPTEMALAPLAASHTMALVSQLACYYSKADLHVVSQAEPKMASTPSCSRCHLTERRPSLQDEKQWLIIWAASPVQHLQPVAALQALTLVHSLPSWSKSFAANMLQQ